MNDQFTGFHHIVIPGTLREALFILDGLLDQSNPVQPTEVMTDTNSYTDVVFGLFGQMILSGRKASVASFIF